MPTDWSARKTENPAVSLVTQRLIQISIRINPGIVRVINGYVY
jgi:hypothetical protein